MRLLEGRDLSREDSETAPPVVVVNQSLARYFCGTESAIGKRLIAAGRPDSRIVGVVSDAKHLLPGERKMLCYTAYRQDIGPLLQTLRLRATR